MTDSQAIEPERSPIPRRQLSRVYAVVLFFVLLSGLALAAWSVLQLRVEQRRALALQDAAAHVERLEVQLGETVGAAYLMAGAIIQDQGRNPGLLVYSIGPLLLQQFPLAAAIQAAPNGVVRFSSPLKGHEGAIGHDLLVDPARNREAHLAVSTRKLTLAGPFSLVQGGMGVVARFPVYLNNFEGWPKFWGFSTVLIHVPRLLEAAGLMDLQRAGYRYSLCRMRDQNGCEVFEAQGGVLPVDPVTVTMAVPNGQWMLAISPEKGWLRPAETGVAALLSLVLAGVLTAFTLAVAQRRETQ